VIDLEKLISKIERVTELHKRPKTVVIGRYGNSDHQSAQMQVIENQPQN
jgi:hypothetical protein